MRGDIHLDTLLRVICICMHVHCILLTRVIYMFTRALLMSPGTTPQKIGRASYGRSVTRGTGCAGPGIIRRGSRSMLDGVCRFVPGIIRWGRESASAVSGCVGPGIIRREQRSVSVGAGCVDPGIIRRGMGVVG